MGILAAHVPATLIDEALDATGRVQQRIRRLPARVTVLFILALTLFANLGYRGVWRELATAPAPTPVTRRRRPGWRKPAAGSVWPR